MTGWGARAGALKMRPPIAAPTMASRGPFALRVDDPACDEACDKTKYQPPDDRHLRSRRHQAQHCRRARREAAAARQDSPARSGVGWRVVLAEIGDGRRHQNTRTLS
jgi:hypothetical protein